MDHLQNQDFGKIINIIEFLTLLKFWTINNKTKSTTVKSQNLFSYKYFSNFWYSKINKICFVLITFFTVFNLFNILPDDIQNKWETKLNDELSSKINHDKIHLLFSSVNYKIEFYKVENVKPL